MKLARRLSFLLKEYEVIQKLCAIQDGVNYEDNSHKIYPICGHTGKVEVFEPTCNVLCA